MPFFQRKDGSVFEVPEEHAEQVLRKQKTFLEVPRPTGVQNGLQEEIKAPAQEVTPPKRGRPRKQ